MTLVVSNSSIKNRLHKRASDLLLVAASVVVVVSLVVAAFITATSSNAASDESIFLLYPHLLFAYPRMNAREIWVLEREMEE